MTKLCFSNEAAAEQETLAAMVQFVRDGMQVAFDPAERALAPPEKEKVNRAKKKNEIPIRMFFPRIMNLTSIYLS